jgi:hypothetical protein
MFIFIIKIKEFLVKALKKVWQNLFLFLFFLLFLDLVIAAVLFFKYSLQNGKIETVSPLKINQGLIDKFSSENQKREKLFQEAKDKIYSDIFNKLQ